MHDRLRLGALVAFGLALIGLQLITVTSANAQTALKWNEDQLTWVAPTTCTDGSPITDCAVTGYRIETAASATATTWSLVTTALATANTYKVTGLTEGPHCYRLASLSTKGQGPYSAVPSSMCATAAAPFPNPPTPTLTDVVAFEIREDASGTLVATRIGILPAGSLCNAETRDVNGVTFNRIDPNAVEPFNSLQGVPPADVYARCAGG